MPSIKIALSTDARGHEYNATLIASILRRTAWDVHVRCWCVGFLPESFEVGKLKVEFLPAAGDTANKYPLSSGPAAYDRLLVIRDCPDWDRCMVMDYDQLVLCDLSPLFGMVMGDHLLAAHMQGPGVDMDYAMRVWLKRPMPEGWEHCGTNPYFLMPPLMNLKAMRDVGTWEKFQQAHAAFGADEQLSLTAATEGRTLLLDKKWNLFPRLHIAKDEVPQGVIHWSGWPKPWIKNADVWRPDIWEAERCSWEHLRNGWWEKPEVWEYQPEDDRGMKALVERGWKVRAVSERLLGGRVKKGGYPDLQVHEEVNDAQASWVRFGQWVDAAEWMQGTPLRPEYVTVKGPMTRSEIDAVRTYGYAQGSRFRSHEWPAGGPMPRVMSFSVVDAERDLLAGEELILRKGEIAGVACFAPKGDPILDGAEPSHTGPRVAVVVPVAQGEAMFLPSFLRALQRNFLPESPKDVLVMLSGEGEAKSACDCDCGHAGCGHAGCGPTHKRVRDVEKLIGSSGIEPIKVVLDSHETTIHTRMMQHAQSWREAEYVYLMRPQMLVQVPVKQEVLGDLVAVWHPGFFDKSRDKFTYEWRHQSAACIAAHEGRAYVTNAWYGGKTQVFSAALARLVEMEQQDQRQGIKAVWAEESYWNRHCVDHPPTVLLQPSYAWTAAVKDQEGVIVQLPMDAYCLTETTI
jgi:lipopolysaccharide biosynthesis glycosyltransferase